MTLLTGLTEAGVEVPVQVLPDGKLVAEGLRGPTGPAGAQGPPGAAGVPGPPSDAVSFRNVLINGDLWINQRNLTHGAVANGSYFADRWKRVDASKMTQIVEDGNFEPNATYTLSGTGIATQQLTSPASGNWTLPSIPATATKIQLERGTVATTFERRPLGVELALCQRYYWRGRPLQAFNFAAYVGAAVACVPVPFPVTMRATPTLNSSLNGATLVRCTFGGYTAATKDGACAILTSTVVTNNANIQTASTDYFEADAEL